MGDVDPALRAAFARWQSAAGPFWPYVCAAPFLALGMPAPPGSGRGALPIALRRALPLAGAPGTLVMADLDPVRTIRHAPELCDEGFVVVPVIQRWIAPAAFVGGAQLLSDLLLASERVRWPANPRGLICLLDGRRLGNKPMHRAEALRRFDNRYRYVTCRFPPPPLLAAHAINQVVWLPSQPAPDLMEYALRLTTAGIRTVVSPGPTRRPKALPTA